MQQRPSSGVAPLPYADVASALLPVIYDSLRIIYDARFRGVSVGEIIPKLLRCASRLANEEWAKAPALKNPHITEGLLRLRPDDASSISRHLRVPRIARLCLEAVYHADGSASDNSHKGPKGILVPSPLAILVDALTMPSNPESGAYGFALARAILFAHFRIQPPSTFGIEGWAQLSLSNLRSAMESFRTYALHRDNIHYPKKDKERRFLAHFLAMRGVFVFRFGTVGKARSKSGVAQRHCLDFLSAKDILKDVDVEDAYYEFRLAPELIDIPDTQETINSLMGVPIPIPGGETTFFGGLQRSHHDSVVISVSGPPGTGKTSFALVMAASLAPLGTRCLYCTFEEDAETLERRALSVVPSYIRRTTLLESEASTWLTAIPLDSTKVDGLDAFTDRYVSAVRRQLSAAREMQERPAGSFPAIAPLLIVIDSLTTLIAKHSEERLEQLCSLVRELKSFNCIVLLLSAEDIPRESRLEYLVDTVIGLRHEGTDSAQEMPVRLLKLAKTRLQMSRPGSHILHLSGERGVRLSPQLPSQLDSHKTHRRWLPDRSTILDTLRPDMQSTHDRNTPESVERLVNLFPRSRILVQGHGSSGKAALGLRLLTASHCTRTGEPVELPVHKRPRILVVSFHHPTEYYDGLFALLRKPTRRSSDGTRAMHSVIALSPSYIGPEDFIGDVLLQLDRAHLEGWPYTGMLLDGLHNTFLQFPALQRNDMMWPALYSLLSRYELTVTTTFTFFSTIQRNESAHHRQDDEVLLQGQRPFLHALVQATDFLLRVEPSGHPTGSRRFSVTAESAVGQRLKAKALVWDGEGFTFDGWASVKRTGDDR